MIKQLYFITLFKLNIVHYPDNVTKLQYVTGG